MISEFIPAILLGIVLSFTIGPVFFTILEISVSKGFKAAVFFNIGVVFSEVVFFAVAYASTSNLLNSIQENPSWKILGGVLLAFYAGITLLGMYQNKEHRADSNRCTSFCRALPSHSATVPMKRKNTLF